MPTGQRVAPRAASSGIVGSSVERVNLRASQRLHSTSLSRSSDQDAMLRADSPPSPNNSDIPQINRRPQERLSVHQVILFLNAATRS